MAYLHGAQIIHRDLKSHNLLVDRHWTIKVGDFGLSRAMDQTASTMTACGTPCWTAPEVLNNERYTIKADVYSFGICLWEMCTREDPYEGMPPYNVIIAVATKVFFLGSHRSNFEGLRPTPVPETTFNGFQVIISVA